MQQNEDIRDGSESDPESLSFFDGSIASVEALRRILPDLTRGVWRPGQKLKVRELNARYGIGPSPLREALSHLAAQGLVLLEGHKGFRVPPISLEQLNDFTRSRQIVEGEALRLALKEGDAAWEGEVLSIFHQLKREIERSDPASPEWQERFEWQHHRFHRALIAACPLDSLTAFCDMLYIKMTRYRRLLKEMGFSGETGRAEHELIVEAILARDEKRAVSMLQRHIGITAEAAGRYLGGLG